MYIYTGNAFFCFTKFRFYNPQPTVSFSHCLPTPNVHLNLLISQNDVYLNPRISLKRKKVLLSYNPQPTLQPSTHGLLQPSTHCLFFPLFTYTQRLVKPSDMSKTNVYLNKVICPKPKIGLFSFWFFSVCVSVCVWVCGCVGVSV